MSTATIPGAPLPLNWWQRLLLPNLPAIAAVAVLYLAVVVMGPEGLLGDSDTGWHIVTGERIIETGTLPRADPYSFTKAGQPWYAWEWLADVFYGAAHKWMGLAGVALFASLLLAGTAWMWCAFAIWLGADRILISAVMAVVVSASTIHWHARPHLLSWPLLIGWLWLLEKTPAKLSPKRLGGVFILAALWTNLHGSFFLAFLLAAAYLAEFWLEDRQRARTLLAETGVALLATFCNPYGWQLHVHLIRYLGNSEMLSQIQEFQSPNFHGGAGLYLILLFFLAIAGVVLCLQQRNFARALAVALFAATGLRAARGIPVIAFAALPLVSAALTRALAGAPQLKGVFEESENFGRIEKQCTGAALLLAVVLMMFGWFARAPVLGAAAFPSKRFPVLAANEVAKLPADARLFSPDQFGGYLIYRFRGGRNVFFDGRSDFYGTQFVKDYLDVVALKPGWRQKFSRFGFTHALVPADQPLREALECAGWKLVYSDKTAALLQRPQAPPASPVCAMP